jgi:hypothetical protein
MALPVIINPEIKEGIMIKVFVGGSIRITKLSVSVVSRIDNMIEKHFTILIGDAYGIDSCIQQYLADKRYENVLVFHAGDTCRNNLGNWNTKTILPDANGRGVEFYALKDLQMAREADYGFMVWNGASKGTLNNIRNLLLNGKKVLVFLSSDQSFHIVRNSNDLFAILSPQIKRN